MKMSDKWMICRLGGLYQFRDFEYVEKHSDGDISCLLYGTGWMRKSARKSHFHGSRHKINNYLVRTAERERDVTKMKEQNKRKHNDMTLMWSRNNRQRRHIDMTLTWSRNNRQRISQLKLPKWRSVLQSSILEAMETEQGYVYAQPRPCPFTWVYNYGPFIEDKIEAVSNLLTKYEKMEITSLLEQALWKAHIVNDGVFESVQDVRNNVVLQQNFDYMEYLNKAKIICGSEIVIPKVINFLGW